jgi:hypothetical protein
MNEIDLNDEENRLIQELEEHGYTTDIVEDSDSDRIAVAKKDILTISGIAANIKYCIYLANNAGYGDFYMAGCNVHIDMSVTRNQMFNFEFPLVMKNKIALFEGVANLFSLFLKEKGVKISNDLYQLVVKNKKDKTNIHLNLSTKENLLFYTSFLPYSSNRCISFDRIINEDLTVIHKEIKERSSK